MWDKAGPKQRAEDQQEEERNAANEEDLSEVDAVIHLESMFFLSSVLWLRMQAVRTSERLTK